MGRRRPAPLRADDLLLSISSCSHDADTDERAERAFHRADVTALESPGGEAESVSRRTLAAAQVVHAWEREQIRDRLARVEEPDEPEVIPGIQDPRAW